MVGVVLLNLGGPRTLADVRPFLTALFQDRDLMRLPAQRRLGPIIAGLRAPGTRRRYQAIGGGSPLLDWTRRQGDLMVESLATRAPAAGSHRCYVAFRYTRPTSEEALLGMLADGVTRAVAFPQYPQYSCVTTGSSLAELWRAVERTGTEDAFEWSVLDTWHSHPAYLQAVAETVREGLAGFDEASRDTAFVLFSAHGLPRSVVERGDVYPQQVAATVQGVVERLDLANPYLLTYQSKVGPAAWQGPSTARIIERLARRGVRNVLVVGISFTSDHIETLFDIDVTLAGIARRAGITGFRRAPALNARPAFGTALATIVADHLARGRASSPRPGSGQRGEASWAPS
ncbi:MAG: ferrochelatase [Micromonosporaceae bacterium]|nr:ferrochelatase [Micromonosporaceae bacterium]